jgi:hypothetical protein
LPIANTSKSVDQPTNRLREVRIELDSLTVVRNRFLNVARVLDRVCEVGERDVESRVVANRLLVHLDRFGEPTEVFEERTEVGVEVRVAVIELETGLVVLHGEDLLVQREEEREHRETVSAEGGRGREKENEPDR